MFVKTLNYVNSVVHVSGAKMGNELLGVCIIKEQNLSLDSIVIY